VLPPTLLAILSVYDKTGLIDFAKELVALNVRILASGGTSKAIAAAGLPVEYEKIIIVQKGRMRIDGERGEDLTTFVEINLL